MYIIFAKQNIIRHIHLKSRCIKKLIYIDFTNTINIFKIQLQFQHKYFSNAIQFKFRFFKIFKISNIDNNIIKTILTFNNIG